MTSPDEAFVLPPLDTLFDAPTAPDLDVLLQVALSPATATTEVDIPSCDIDLDDLADSGNSTDITVAGFDFDEISESTDLIDLGMDEPIEQLPPESRSHHDIDFNDAELDGFDDHSEGL